MNSLLLLNGTWTGLPNWSGVRSTMLPWCRFSTTPYLFHLLGSVGFVIALLEWTLMNFVAKVHYRKLNEWNGLVNWGVFSFFFTLDSISGYFPMSLLLYYGVYTGLSNRDKYVAVPISVSLMWLLCNLYTIYDDLLQSFIHIASVHTECGTLN